MYESLQHDDELYSLLHLQSICDIKHLHICAKTGARWSTGSSSTCIKQFLLDVQDATSFEQMVKVRYRIKLLPEA